MADQSSPPDSTLNILHDGLKARQRLYEQWQARYEVSADPMNTRNRDRVKRERDIASRVLYAAVHHGIVGNTIYLVRVRGDGGRGVLSGWQTITRMTDEMRDNGLDPVHDFTVTPA